MDISPVKYERHLFVCVNEKPGQCCGPAGGQEILDVLRAHVNARGLFHRFNVSKVSCFGHCLAGPTVAVYPEGVILTHVSPRDTEDIIRRFLR